MDKECAVKGNYASLQDVVGFVSFRAGIDNGASGFMRARASSGSGLSGFDRECRRCGGGACGLMRFGSALAVVSAVSCGRVRVLAVVPVVLRGVGVGRLGETGGAFVGCVGGLVVTDGAFVGGFWARLPCFVLSVASAVSCGRARAAAVVPAVSCGRL